MDNPTQATNEREFLGVTQNQCTFQGKVVGDPIIQGDNYAFMYLKTVVTEQSANGQWNDVPVQIPIMTTDPRRVAAIQKYVHDGRELLVYTSYKPWMHDNQPQHAFVLRNLQLGRKKWVPKDQVSTPDLPT